MVQEKPLAAIDLGTNSFHMIIVRVRTNGTFEAIAREKESVRLGNRLQENGPIDSDSFRRGIDCLKRFKILAENAGAEIRAVATSALREASNREEFLEVVYQETGISIDVVSGYEEARLIYFGILQGIPVFDRKIMMIDIGGGSTEILVGHRGNILFSKSFKLGAIRLTEKFFQEEPLSNSGIRKCRLFIEEMLLPFRKILRDLKPDLVVGSSGTIQAIAGMILASRGESEEISLNNFSFLTSEFKKIRNLILEADTSRKRTKIPGLDSKRADIIIGGTLILEEIFDLANVPALTVSEFALREGIVYDTIRKWEHFESREHSKHLDAIRQTSVDNFMRAFSRDEEYSKHVANLSLQIFDQLASMHKLGQEQRELLEAASLLHEIGQSISHSAYHKHSYYMIRNSEMLLGFTFLEIEIIALTARYHRKNTPKLKHREFNKLAEKNRNLVCQLSAILRISSALNRNRGGLVPSVTCKTEKNQIRFVLHTNKGYDPSLEIWAAEEQKIAFEETFGYSVEFVTGNVR
ncbi:Ppx/GppA phosphatase family protein [Leptospira borgpetersenii]|uniref:Ppx/GppA phosphatase family protein n=1 Tax=Leptospira borgpetersenii TaxID=174 RepID=UPI000773B480|nr:Ppx/GppA phosphatase family protein [Leptospira borgpetersenii]MBE8398880.1 Ppx/GppA family phosphatase [Leptospira borgpetersenii serovar Tarassovi]MBE8402013.1 Ppx/GppA family phosphatase [Leptospira borgpetersenii serovar Tarassovi]MBE8405000.1 Ppx/GppA family phosphatase [Leptospira borgpetersenii serovar Tarassovi]MBE8411310.1 Ppx/GppA family phosphatase [Leptospira borgpetersenii serovar Tarassovi]MBE8414427.1 Ppx/GppA family phosphatase [Leptospira borgpetersenii serovar Tarassovi]